MKRLDNLSSPQSKSDAPGQPRKILIAGATGYIASRLIPRLLASGYAIRCLARSPEHLRAREWFSRVEVIAGDVARPESLPAAMQNISAAYYLIHSMASGHAYHHLDPQLARNFASAAKSAGVEHIIYLGGLANPQEKLALHLHSRIETGAALREAGVPVTEFRAGVIVGPGSSSFEMVRFIAEQFPIIIGPAWLKHRTQPIAISDIIQYLQVALVTPACRGKIVELGCKIPRTYAKVMTEYAQIRGLKRKTFLLPLIPPWLMAFCISKLTPIKFFYALPLVKGLQNDSLVRDFSARHLFPSIQPLDYADAVRLALTDLSPGQVELTWLNSKREHARLRREGFLIDSRTNNPGFNLPVDKDKLKPGLFPLVTGWETVAGSPAGVFLFAAQGNLPGKLWLKWQEMPAGAISRIVFFAPKGFSGFVYWFFIQFWL